MSENRVSPTHHYSHHRSWRRCNPLCRRLSSRPSYGDDAISYVQLKREGNICTVKCKICPEHKVHAKLYAVTLIVDEDEEKYGRVTASKVYEVSRYQTDDGTLISIIMGGMVPDTPAMKRGRYLENEVQEIASKKPEKNIKNCGLFISQKYPIFVQIGTVIGSGIRIESGTRSRIENGTRISIKSETGIKMRTGPESKTSMVVGSKSSVTGIGIEDETTIEIALAR
ncbi:hypothetical protein EVAR_48925_1 [Eumeta japonica]|uniref:Uncharacterized protein n=1 Tax=Eumeta variegata TaxID=151549 RepID=A0A4C1YSK6_EUMVA|nr:hypothetical protein EVAR_48925_1 [Eumeta japonica]